MSTDYVVSREIERFDHFTTMDSFAAIKWQPVGSGSRKLGNYLVNMGRYQDGMGGMYLYEMNPNMTGQVLQEYLK